MAEVDGGIVYLRILALCAACITVGSCGGNSFIGFVSNPGGSSSISGTVSAVSNGVSSGPSGTTEVTLVTFVNPETAIPLYFCGAQGGLFPIKQKVSRGLYAGHPLLDTDAGSRLSGFSNSAIPTAPSKLASSFRKRIRA
ncbi:MAG TPA: hypothetical protein VMG82_10505 [Candidatus Sulfotelmatobacter sp.]|nr:hypothetical protein [Candidatus Sulfotelmatobacter sp.]